MKKFRLFILALALTLCFGALAACNHTPSDGGDPDEVVYTVSVTCEESYVLEGLKVQLKTADGAVAEEKALPTPNNGVSNVSFELPAARYTVNLTAKEGNEQYLRDYVYTLGTLTAINRSALVSLTPADEVSDPVTYTLTVQYPDGTPASAIHVQLCGGPKNVCNAQKTDASGVAVFTLDAGEYEVHISEHPAGYTFDDTQYKMTAENNTLTVSFKAA